MNSHYSHFHDLKNAQKEQKKSERADVTVKYYKMIMEMLESGNYEESENFLQSVQQYIETKEFISDKQIEIVERIYDHPENMIYGYLDVPF